MMTVDQNRALRTRRTELLNEAKELSAKGRLSPAEQTRFDSLMQLAEQTRQQYETGERRDGRPPSGDVDGTERRTDQREVAHRSAFKSYLRTGLQGMPHEERGVLTEFRDMGSGGQGAYPGATSGFFVPLGFVNSIIESLKFTGPMVDASVVEMMDTATGAPLPYPSDNDVSVTGERVGEGQQVTSTDVSISALMLGAYKYSSRLVKVSIELLQDSAFDLESYLIKKFALRLGRTLNSDFTVGLGSGSSQPLGLLTSTVTNGTLVAAVGSSSNDGTGASTNTLGSDDFINLEHGIDVLYRPNASYMAHDSVWKAVRKVKDKFGRNIWQPALVAGQPDTINGYRMLTNNYMDTLQVNAGSPPVTKNTVVFGDMKRFLVRRVKEMSVLRLEERFADFGFGLSLSPAV
jgi:HK97 family phage major capsid protein